MKNLSPKDHGEAVALFRMQLLGPLLNRDFERGELLAELRRISKVRVRPPMSPRTRTYALSTLQRWYYDFRRDGLEALRPTPRADSGHCRKLSEDKRELLLEIRRQHPRAATSVIVRTLVADGRLEQGEVSEETVRRLYREHQLARCPHDEKQTRERQRWEASHPGALWHADVCHGRTLELDGKHVPVRVHAILDDVSRYVVGLQVLDHERESAMLGLWVEAVRNYGASKVLYLDNGSTYRGEALSTACGRVGTSLVHARPYDPQARGKMERFWRTLRVGCLDVMGRVSSLDDVQLRLLAFVDQHYHKAPHAGLMGKAPKEVWAEREVIDVDEAGLKEALCVRERRLVRADCTVSVGGMDWELRAGFLARKRVTLARSFHDATSAPWVEFDDARYELWPIDPKRNGRKAAKRVTTQPKTGVDAVLFDPASVMLDLSVRRRKKLQGGAK